MRNLGRRLIVWFVGVPSLIAIILFLPQLNHLAFNSLVVIFSALGARELAKLFARNGTTSIASGIAIPLMGAALPLTQLLIINDIFPAESFRIVLYCIGATVLLAQLFRKDQNDFQNVLANIAANLTILFYPGFFLAYLVRLSGNPEPGFIILAFLLSVFANDTLAYVVGMLYRTLRERIAAQRNTTWQPRWVLPVSPKKTVVGFIGGLVASPVTLLIYREVFPGVLTEDTLRIVVIGFAIGVATIIGDLVESSIKRSATSKDSGSLIPGRGGILDSADSVLYAAPVFYYLLQYLI